MTPEDFLTLRHQLMVHEGLRLFPYTDTAGKLTIGYGRNLTDKGITLREAEQLLDHDITDAIQSVLMALPWTSMLSAARFRVLVDIAFNAGINGLLGFPKMLIAAQQGDYTTAANEIVNSHLAPHRAEHLADIMRTA